MNTQISWITDYTASVKMGYWKGEPWRIIVLEGETENRKYFFKEYAKLGVHKVFFEGGEHEQES